MIQISRLRKSYSQQILFDDVTFSMIKGEKLGFLGRNGSGKSTFFKLIMGEEEVDEGEIIIPRTYRVGALKQHLEFTHETVLEECCSVLSADAEREHYRAEKILSGLGFAEEMFHQSPAVFSGGFQVRISLAKLLVTEPDLLLLDEPTNYLDILSIRWLIGFLSAFAGEFILITHDRGFMDSVTTHTMGIHRKRVLKIKGDTSKYYDQLSEAEEHYEKRRAKQEQTVRHMQKYIDRFRASARRASQAQSRIKKLSKLKDVVELGDEESLSFSFKYKEFPAKIFSEYQHLSFTYPGMKKTLIEDFSLFVKKGDRIAIVGKNGAGKSTLLNLMAGELVPLSGKATDHPQTQRALFGQMNIERLNKNNTIEEEIGFANPDLTYGQAKSICGLMLFERDLSKKKVSVLSGGERSRVLLGKILAKQANVLLLDEPTNHLDQVSIEGLMDGFEEFEGAIILVTHSEMILRQFAKRLIVFHHDEIFVFEGSYDDFLSRVGWDEDKESRGAQKTEKGLSKKEKRQQRSQIIAQKSRLLTPLKNRMASLEKEIEQCEQELEEIHKSLVVVSTQQDVDKTVSLSKELKDKEIVTAHLYNDLEKVTLEYEKTLVEFEKTHGGNQ